MNDGFVCPDCSWAQRPHPTYGWLAHHARAVEVHRERFCAGNIGRGDN